MDKAATGRPPSGLGRSYFNVVGFMQALGRPLYLVDTIVARRVARPAPVGPLAAGAEQGR